MKLDPKYKLDKVVSKDITRGNLTSVWLDVEKTRAIGCNGYALVIVPVVIEDGDTTGKIPTQALELARKAKENSPSIGANGAIVVNGITMPRDPTGSLPPVDEVTQRTAPYYMAVCLNPWLLVDIAEAMGIKKNGESPGVALAIPIDAKVAEDGTATPDVSKMTSNPILVSTGKSDAIGVLMPMRE